MFGRQRPGRAPSCPIDKGHMDLLVVCLQCRATVGHQVRFFGEETGGAKGACREM